MVYILDGKRHDPEKSTKVAYREHCRRGDWHYVRETLYRTAKGNWFLEWEGGPLSCYGRREGSDLYGNAGAYRFTADMAREWLEENEKYSALEKYFGESLEDA